MEEALSMEPQDFWQAILPAGELAPSDRFTDAYPVTLPDGRQLLLPIRALPDGDNGLASLIVNQASFAVQAVLCGMLTEKLRGFSPEIVVGLPTLGLTVASAVAAALGHHRYVPLGTSRKFWYDRDLSVPLASITTPDTRHLYLDPRLRPLLVGRRVVLIDDVLSTGRSIAAAMELMRKLDIKPVAIGALMLQTDRWRDVLASPHTPVAGVFSTPLLQRDGDAWRAA